MTEENYELPSLTVSESLTAGKFSHSFFCCCISLRFQMAAMRKSVSVKVTNLDDLETPVTAAAPPPQPSLFIGPRTACQGNAEQPRKESLQSRILFHTVIIVLVLIGVVAIYFLASGSSAGEVDGPETDHVEPKTLSQLKKLMPIRDLSIYNECKDLGTDCHRRAEKRYYEQGGFKVIAETVNKLQY